MSNALYFVPPRGPFVDPRTGELSRSAVRFLSGLFDRVGGTTGESTTDLATSAFEDAGIEETKAALYRLADDLRVAPPSIPATPGDDDPTQRLAALEATVAELRKELDALRVGPTVL